MVNRILQLEDEAERRLAYAESECAAIIARTQEKCAQMQCEQEAAMLETAGKYDEEQKAWYEQESQRLSEDYKSALLALESSFTENRGYIEDAIFSAIISI